MTKVRDILEGVLRYKNLLYELVTRDIRIRYRRSVLGLLWTMLNPVLMMIVMTVVFSRLFRFEIEYFPIYLFTGNILFSFTTESTTNAMHSIEEGASLIKKVYVPKYLFPASKVCASVVNLFFSVVSMLIIMLLLHVPMNATLFLMPIVLAYLVLFCMGLGMLLASLQVFFRDVAHLYQVFTLAWMYLTPVFYPESLLSEHLSIVLVLNPMVHYIRFMRNVVLYNTVPSVTENLTCLSISVMLLLIGSFVFYRRQDRFILYI